jgi:hypothetical protein
MLTRKAPIPAAPAPIGVGDVVRFGRSTGKVVALGGAYATVFRRRSVAQGHTLRRVRITDLKRIG